MTVRSVFEMSSDDWCTSLELIKLGKREEKAVGCVLLSRAEASGPFLSFLPKAPSFVVTTQHNRVVLVLCASDHCSAILTNPPHPTPSS